MARQLLVLAAALVCACLLSQAAAARPAAITGKLDKRGYTLVVIGYDGKAVSTRARSFRLRPRSGKVTLHLRDRRGKYAGPVLVGRSGKRGIVGVKAGAHLGRVLIRRGYAETKRALKRRSSDRSRTAQLKHGRPLGNGRNFGLVRSLKRGRSGSGTGRDRDLDGVPDAFDIDVDGDRILNPLERGGARASGVTPPGPTPPGPTPPGPTPPGPPASSASFNNFSQLFLQLDQTVNANAAAVTQAQIDAAMRANLSVIFLNVLPGTELDCGGLTWCSHGGGGLANAEPWRGDEGKAFPDELDPDDDGFGTMELTDRNEFRLQPRATSSQIGSGDLMIERTSEGGEIPGTLAFVFNTVPAIQTWRDGSGNGATISYPVAENAPGTSRTPLVFHRDTAGDYVVTYTVWRPQRRAIASAGEDGDYVDVGGLAYEVNVPNVPRSPSAAPGTPSAPQCPAASMSTSDPQLSVSESGAGGRFLDSARDQAADRDNTLTFTINLSRCAELRGGSLAPGDHLNLDVSATPTGQDAHDVANQLVFVELG